MRIFELHELLSYAVEKGASDLHITVGVEPIVRVNSDLVPVRSEQDVEGCKLTPEDTENYVKQALTKEQLEMVNERGQLDFSYSIPGLARFRVNCYKQRGSYALAFRVLYNEIPVMEKLGIPPIVAELSMKQRGLILVTGPTGSGKSTTLAAMIHLINQKRKCHIVTLEDPIEFLHKHNKSIINQREVGHDTNSFADGLRAALRQDPDVILVGEMRDLETISIAITAAETGHLVLSTLHTTGAARTVDRIIDVFPSNQQLQVRIQMAGVMEGIISQQLLPKADHSGRVVAFEILTATPAVRNLIREGKNHQIDSSIQTGAKYGMVGMDHTLEDLYRRGVISKDTMLSYALDVEMMRKRYENR